jgi:hypothetical protein
MIVALFAAALLEAGPTPAGTFPDGTRLVPGEQCFAIERGEERIGDTTQSVTAEELDGEPVWRIVIHQTLRNGRFSLRDEFVVARDTLRPLALTSLRGNDPASPSWQRIELRYSSEGVTGTRTTAKESAPIVATIDRPVWDGNLWGLTFAALPLAAGAEFSLPNWQYDKGAGAFTVLVVGEETVETPAGSVAAWTIDAGTDPEQLVRYRIAKSGGIELGYSGNGMAQRLATDCPAR